MLKLASLMILVCLAELLLVQPSDSCKSNDDCPPGKCCRNLLIATRRDINNDSLIIGSPPNKGTCIKLTPVGQSCNTYDSCGCAKGSECQPKEPSKPVNGSAEQQRYAAPGNYICVRKRKSG